MLTCKTAQMLESLAEDKKINAIFDEIDQKTEVGEFTQDETTQEDQEVEQEQI